ncbi:MAG: hypothetical protein M3125_07990 [Gemmatimonadota bacterium]|nr:hypothetical protein [Gemmatimonadota bacterium]
MSFRSLATIAALAIAATSAAAQTPTSAAAASSESKPKMPAPPTTDLVVAGRQLAEWILTNQLDSVAAHLGPGENADTTTMELTRFLEELAIRGGNEVKVTDEKVVRRLGNYQYWRTADYDRAPGAVLLRIVLTPDGKYGGIGIGLANNPPPVDP